MKLFSFITERAELDPSLQYGAKTILNSKEVGYNHKIFYTLKSFRYSNENLRLNKRQNCLMLPISAKMLHHF